MLNKDIDSIRLSVNQKKLNPENKTKYGQFMTKLYLHRKHNVI